MQEEFWIQNSIIVAIKINVLHLGRRAMIHHIDPKFFAAKMSDITTTCKLLVISSLVQIANILKINNLHNIMIWRSSTWVVSLKVFYQFYLFSSMSSFNYTWN